MAVVAFGGFGRDDPRRCPRDPLPRADDAGGRTGVASLLGRGAARLAGRRLAPGWRSAALGAAALALLCLVPPLGAPVALAALVLACGGAVSRRGTLSADSPDEVPR